ncbi:MAG: F0F1 ATP synthase subunit B [Bacillota bacterium]
MEKIGIEYGTMIVMVINFGILIAVLIRLLYRPIQGILEQRRQKIVRDLDDAKTAKEKAEQLHHQAQIILEEAHVEAYETVEKSKLEAERLREELLKQATKEVDRLRQRANAEIERSKLIARDEIRNEAVNLALMAVTKILGTHLSQEMDTEMIQSVIDDLEKEAATSLG